MRLFRVEPIGLETDEVESFSSYLLRLAQVHGVTLGRLLTALKDAYSKDYPGWQEDAVTQANPESLANMVRPIDSAAEILTIVEHYTGVECLRATTFQALRRVAYASQGLFHRHIRWCPQCLREDVEFGRAPYFRLLWAFKDLKVCPTHHTAIVTRCPACYARQNSVVRRKRVHRCHRCRTALLEPHEDEKLPQRTDQHDCCDLAELTRWVASDPELVFEEDAARRLLRAVFDRVWALEDERNFWKVLPKEQSLMISYSNRKLTMRMLRRIAYRLGVSLPALLAGEIECWTPQLDARWLEDLPHSMNPAKRRRRHDRSEVLKRLLEYREAIVPESPPPLATVAKDIGISTGGLEYLFPAISGEIKAAYQAWRVSERRRKRLEATVAVMEYLAEEGTKKTRKGALKQIRAQTGLPKNVLREVIATTFDEEQVAAR